MEAEEFVFFGGKVRFKQPKKHRLSVVELLFLSNLKGVKKNSKVVDLGAGFGTLSILTSLKYGCEVWAVERDETMLELLNYNVRINQLDGKVHVIEGDIRFIERFMKRDFFDNVLLNPPFYPRTYRNKNNYFHFETDTDLADFIKATKYVLKDGGRVNLLYTAFRCMEAFLILKNNNINPYAVRIFYPKAEKNGKFIHIYGIKNGKGYMTIEKPLIINRNDGEYTDEVKSVLYGFL